MAYNSSIRDIQSEVRLVPLALPPIGYRLTWQTEKAFMVLS